MPRRNFNPSVHTRNKAGKLVSKAKSERMKTSPWALAVKEARKQLGITGFHPVRKGEPLHTLAKKIYGR